MDTIIRIFEAQKKYTSQLAQTTAKERKAKLKKLLVYIKENEKALLEAMYADLRKPKVEVLFAEIMMSNNEIKHQIKHLSKWMKPQKTSTPITHLGYSSHIKYEPKGTVLIISPWNYPFNLTMLPLAAAIAAGNSIMIKPSEVSAHVSAFIKKMITDLFDEKEIAVFEGDYKTATALLDLPFNHIFFTGSPEIGKVVMKAASKNLTSVTLELGGKSPVIVDETANIKDIAQKIAWGKMMNSGQTCIAPDYILVHQSVQEKLISEFTKNIDEMLNSDNNGIENSKDYSRIINKRHFERVKNLLDDAIKKGAKSLQSSPINETDNFIAPTLLTDVNDEMSVMQNEIFGPLLPLISYNQKEEVINYINKGEKPLALYICSGSKKNIQYFLNNTSAGGTVINDLLIHFGHASLPFGGVNNSGIGKSGGFYGFEAFSNARGILQQNIGTFRFLYPPYTPKVEKIVRLLMKYL